MGSTNYFEEIRLTQYVFKFYKRWFGDQSQQSLSESQFLFSFRHSSISLETFYTAVCAFSLIRVRRGCKNQIDAVIWKSFEYLFAVALKNDIKHSFNSQKIEHLF